MCRCQSPSSDADQSLDGVVAQIMKKETDIWINVPGESEDVGLELEELIHL